MILKEILEKRVENLIEKNSKKSLEFYKCEKCKDKLFILKDDVAYECECRKLRIIEDKLNHSGICGEFRNKTLKNFNQTKELSKAFENCINYIKNFKGESSMMILGRSGVGKTHLAIGVANSLINRNIGVYYMQYRDSITKLKQSVMDFENYTREISKYKNAEVLLIDDLFKGRISESDVNIMYEIINERYFKKMPVIVTSEKTLDELIEIDEAIGSRLFEMAKDYTSVITGENLNYRLK